MKSLVFVVWWLILLAGHVYAKDALPSMKQVKLFPYDFVGQTLVFRDVTLVNIDQGSLTLKKPFPRNIPYLAVTKSSENLSISFGDPEIIVTPELGKAVLPFIGRHANLVITVFPWHERFNASESQWTWKWYVEKIEIVSRNSEIEKTISPINPDQVRSIMGRHLELWEDLKLINAESDQRNYETEQSPGNVPQREKMSGMMQHLLEEATVQNLEPSPAVSIPQQPEHFSSTSIKHHAQQIEVTSTSSLGNSFSQTSPGENQYLAMVQDKIDREWRTPLLGTTPPAAVFKFRVTRTGEISNIHIEESSGSEPYDSSANQAIAAVNPLPPFPDAIKEEYFDIRFRFINK